MGRDLEIDICLNRNKNHRLTEEATKAVHVEKKASNTAGTINNKENDTVILRAAKSAGQFKQNYNNKRAKAARVKKAFLVGSATMILILVFAMLFFSHGVKATDSDSEVLYKYYQMIEIEKGDTLWGIAEEYGLGNNRISYIEEVRSINNMDNYDLIAGNSICIPYYSTEYKN